MRLRRDFFLAIVYLLPMLVIFAGGSGLTRLPLGLVYLLDIVLVIVFLVGTATLSRPAPGFLRNYWPVILAYSIAISIALIHLISDGVNLAHLQSAAPYMYMSYGLFLLVARVNDGSGWERFEPLLLTTSLAVFSGVLLLRRFGLEFVPRGFPESISLVRPDFDGILMGSLAGALVWNARSQSAIMRILGLVLATGLLTFSSSLGSRAGFMGSVLAFLLIAVGGTNFRWHKAGHLGLVILPPLVSTITALLFFPLSAKIRGGLAVLGKSLPSDNPSSESEQAVSSEITGQLRLPDQALSPPIEGPTTARLEAWSTLLGWYADQGPRLFGWGFDFDFFVTSGSKNALVGPNPLQDTNWPHNFLLTIYGQTGFFGTLGIVFILGAAALIGLRNIRTLNLGQSIALGLLAGLMFSASVGVIFETPFGSLSLAWAAFTLIAVRGSRLRKPSDE